MSENKKDKNVERTKTTLFVPDDLGARFRVKAAIPNLSLQQVVVDLLQKWVDGVDIHPPCATQEEIDTFNGFVAWLRDRQDDQFWAALTAEWLERGQRIRSQSNASSR